MISCIQSLHAKATHTNTSSSALVTDIHCTKINSSYKEQKKRKTTHNIYMLKYIIYIKGISLISLIIYMLKHI